MRINVKVMLDVVDLTGDWKKRVWQLMVFAMVCSALNSG